jgi:hypothetical protein
MQFTCKRCSHAVVKALWLFRENGITSICNPKYLWFIRFNEYLGVAKRYTGPDFVRHGFPVICEPRRMNDGNRETGATRNSRTIAAEEPEPASAGVGRELESTQTGTLYRLAKK